MALTLMYITNNIEVALIAEKNGVERIWIDLEVLGKEERQKGMNTVKSKHSINDICKIKPHLTNSDVLVRINPWNNNSKEEIEQVINAGADIIMLPMWKTLKEVSYFLKTVNKRCKTTLLLETKEAVECLDEVLDIGGMDEIHIGLNDLHLSYGLSFMFELLSNGTVEYICNKIASFGIPYGFGGIARIRDGMLPAEKVIIEHYRLGSTRAILSRSFCNTEVVQKLDEIENQFMENMRELRCFEKTINNKTDFKKNQMDVCNVIDAIVREKKGK